MDAITGISGSIASGQMQLPSLTAAAGGEVTGISAFDSQSIISASSTSISSSVESFIGTYGPLASNNELLGAILLLLMSEYLKGGDEEEKKRDTGPGGRPGPAEPELGRHGRLRLFGVISQHREQLVPVDLHVERRGPLFGH